MGAKLGLSVPGAGSFLEGSGAVGREHLPGGPRETFAGPGVHPSHFIIHLPLLDALTGLSCSMIACAREREAGWYSNIFPP